MGNGNRICGISSNGPCSMEGVQSYLKASVINRRRQVTTGERLVQWPDSANAKGCFFFEFRKYGPNRTANSDAKNPWSRWTGC